MAQIKGKIGEVELQILQIDQDMRSEVGRDLAEIRGKISELSERKIAAEDNLKRIDIRAPQDGVVLQLSVHTVGGVIGPGEFVPGYGDKLLLGTRPEQDRDGGPAACQCFGHVLVSERVGEAVDLKSVL